jgi:hypothetical protein
MKNLLKTVFLKTMVVVALLLAASLLVTCDLLFPPDEDGGNGEYTDVEYETFGAKGNERVKSVKLYLKPDSLDQDALPGPGTYGVKKSAQQRRIERALTVEGARMSHDYFEAVFMSNATTVARAAWEIGQPAGIAGLSRQTGENYRTPAPANGTTINTGSIIFVGRKTGKTLMGVGYLTHVNDKPVTTDALPPVDGGTTSVTFTVSPLATWIGFNGDGSNNNPYVVNTRRSDVNLAAATPGIDTGLATFSTATGRAVNASTGVHDPVGTFTSGTPATAIITTGEMYAPFAGVTFPMYYLPSAKAANWTATVDTLTVSAQYFVGGLTSATIWSGDPIFTTPNPAFANGNTDGLTNAVRVWGHLDGAGGWTETQGTGDPAPARTDTSDLKGGLQFIKRTPAFMFEGINYEITSTYTDKITQVNTIAIPAGNAFTGNMQITFTVRKGTSGGIFAVTFQCPVYALTAIRAGNTGNLPPEKWFIRPDYSQYQYLLDNGKDSGGAVLLGTDVAGGADWIQINTQGIGFSNE